MLSMGLPISFRERDNLRDPFGHLTAGSVCSRWCQSMSNETTVQGLQKLEGGEGFAQSVVTESPSEVLPLEFNNTTAVFKDFCRFWFRELIVCVWDACMCVACDDGMDTENIRNKVEGK